MNVPPPPPGFQLDGQAPNGATGSLPPPPSGFVVDASSHNSLPFSAQQAQGEMAMQESGHKLVSNAPPSAVAGLPPEGTVYTMQQVAPPHLLSQSEKVAIQDAYNKQYGFMPNPTTPTTEAGLEGQRSTAQINQAAMEGNTFAQNASAAFGQQMAHVGTGIVGTVVPGTANALQQNVNANLVAEPGSVGSFVGNTAGMLTLAAPSIVAPGLAARGLLAPAAAQTVNEMTAITLGSQAFGQVRQEVQQRRAEGQQISTQDELTAAALSAVNTFAASKVSQAAMQRLGQQFLPGMQKSLVDSLSAYVVNTGVQASDQMVMTAVQNAIRQKFYAPEANGAEGVAEAGATGGIVGAIGGAASIKAHAGPAEVTPEAATAAAPSPEVMKTLTTAPQPEAPAEPAPFPKSLEQHQPSLRLNNGQKSVAVPLDFESPRDRALYYQSEAFPRKGKLSADAATYAKGTPEEVAAVHQRVAKLGEDYLKFPEGDSIRVPSAEATNGTAVAAAGVGGDSGEAAATRPEASMAAVATPVKAEFQPDVNNTDHQEGPDDHLAAAVEQATRLIRGFKEQAPADRQQAKVREAFKALGRDVVFYDGEGRGVRIHGHDNVLFINRKNVAADLNEAVSHEFWHDVQSAHPDLADAIRQSIDPSALEQAKTEYAQKYEAMRPGEKLDDATLNREAEALVMGDAARRGRVFRALTGEKATVWQKLQDVFSKFADKLRGKSKLIDTALDGFLQAREVSARREAAPRETDRADFLPTPTERVRDEAEEYTKTAGLPYHPDQTYAPVNEPRAKAIADWYEKAQHNPNDPQVKASYNAFKKETLAQWKFLESKGVKFEPWQGEGQPYKNSDEVIRDIRDNKHLAFYTGGDMPADHPLAEKSGVKVNGQDLTYNDVFRAVHDYFGHAKEGVGFGPRGEENAWRSHSQMYSELARPAMTAETRGQNSWVNFGPFGEQNRAKPTETRYAEQKATVAPAEHMDFLPGKQFVEEDVKPKLKAVGEAVAKAWEGIKSLTAPFTRSGEASTAKDILRERGSELQQRFDRLGEAFGDAKKLMGGMDTAATRQFISDIENGRKQTDPALQPLADAVRAILDDRLQQVQALGTGRLKQFVEDYFPHIWKDPTKAANVYAEVMAKAPLQGGKKFLKQRSLALMSDGFAKGLEPVTENPIEATMLRVREMDKYITAHQAFQEMNGKGLLQKIPAREQVPAGFAKINDNIATIYAKPSRRGAVQVQSYFVAPEPVANVINNYLSPGLRGNKFFGPAFRGFLGAGNLMNSVQLGLSGFHLAFTTMDSMISKAALSIEQLAAGDFRNAAKSAAITATVFGPVVENVRRGNQVMQEWYKPGSTTPEIATLVDAMKAAGGRVKMDDFYRTDITSKMMETLKRGNVIGAALRLPFSLMELTGKPILEHLVPRVKLGAFMDLARAEFAKNSGMSRDELRESMGKVWDSVDNRLGEMVYDNLFWNKSFKDLAMASVRSVGWNLGTLRELGGGLLDTAKFAGLIRSRQQGELTHRMAYTIAMPIVTGMVGGMIHYLLTGKHPDELKDYFFPKTGQKDNDGHDVRLSLPSYMKDVFAYGKDIKTAVQEKRPTAALQTLGHKVHPMLNTVLEMLNNKDYYGTKVYNEDDSIVKNLTDLVEHAGKSVEPFGIREAVKLMEQGQGAKSLLPLVGVTTARKDLTHTDAENRVAELLRNKLPQGARTQEEADKSALIRDIADRIRAKDPSGRTDLAKAVKAGEFTEADVENVKDRIRHTGLESDVRSLRDVTAAFKVWDVATPAERKKIAPVLAEELANTKSLPMSKRAEYARRLKSDLKYLNAE